MPGGNQGEGVLTCSNPPKFRLETKPEVIIGGTTPLHGAGSAGISWSDTAT